MHVFEKWDEQDILARTIYGEARGEFKRIDGGLGALISIGNVVMNRVQEKKWFGHSIREVCLKPYQFSCWNKNDPNYNLLLKIEQSDEIFNICYKVAGSVMEHNWPDLTKGSNHYYARSLRTPPVWAQGQIPEICIGGHLFFQLS